VNEQHERIACVGSITGAGMPASLTVPSCTAGIGL
jgi:hypothetical protein